MLVLQVLVLGRLAVVALPLEPTTVAGRRVTRSVGDALAARGVEAVVVGGYSNGYAGYLTTREEYGLQLYEGASTLFGQWSLAALQTSLARACEGLCTPHADRDPDRGPPVSPIRASDVYPQLWMGAHS